MNYKVNAMSVSQAMFMAGNNPDIAAAMISYYERGTYVQRREYLQAAEAAKIARAVAIGHPAVGRA